MAKYRNNLPQLSVDLFITDGGLETEVIFRNGIELPEFASFVLLENDKGIKILQDYYLNYITIARDCKVGFILESPTWRASSDWGKGLGYSDTALDNINRKAVKLLAGLRKKYENRNTKMVISGCIGPRGDGYNPSEFMDEDQAENYHFSQIKTLSKTDADLVSAFTMTYSQEAIGIIRAAGKVDIPAVISFTVETDGRLPSGETLEEAIIKVDKATKNGPAYYMVNCAHPDHFKTILSGERPWIQRIHGIRANASRKSHAELDESCELDSGNPVELGDEYDKLRNKLDNLNIFGGCCGTGHQHIQEICLHLGLTVR